ncbi:putative membrane protein, partial [Escherichia coli 5-366-08_S4_C1]
PTISVFNIGAIHLLMSGCQVKRKTFTLRLVGFITLNVSVFLFINTA